MDSICCGCCGLFGQSSEYEAGNRTGLLVGNNSPCGSTPNFQSDTCPTPLSMSRISATETSPSYSDLEDSRAEQERLLLAKTFRDSTCPNAETSSRPDSGSHSNSNQRSKPKTRRDKSHRKAKSNSSVDDSIEGKEEIIRRFKASGVDECPICLEEFDEESPATFLSCGHAFHLHCIYEWLERSETCAVCQTQIQGYEDQI